MPVLRHAGARRSETPGGVMTTLSSPTQGDAELCLWRVDMHPDAAGPPHRFDLEQVWFVLDGGAVVELDGETHRVEAGDTVVMPANVPRRVLADATGFAAVVTAPAGGRAYRAGEDEAVVPPWTV